MNTVPCSIRVYTTVRRTMYNVRRTVYSVHGVKMNMIQPLRYGQEYNSHVGSKVCGSFEIRQFN